MTLKNGDSVTLSHFSGMNPIKSCVVKSEDGMLNISINEEFSSARIMVGDPIVMVFESKGEIFTCECSVEKIDLIEKLVKIKVENKQSTENCRLFERFPVCLYAGIKHGEEKKSSTAIIKNLSMSGLAINTKQNIKIGNELEVEVYLDERVIPIMGEVAWKKEVINKYEYGLKTTYPDYSVKNSVRLYLSILKGEQEQWVSE